MVNVLETTPPVPVIKITNLNNSSAVGLNSVVNFDGSNSYDPGGGKIDSYTWYFGDGASATCQTASHSYTQAGVYTVDLKVVNAQGKNTADKTTQITVTQSVSQELMSMPQVPLALLLIVTLLTAFFSIKWFWTKKPILSKPMDT